MAAKNGYFLMTDFSAWEMPILADLPSLRGVTGQGQRPAAPVDGDPELPAGALLDVSRNL